MIELLAFLLALWLSEGTDALCELGAPLNWETHELGDEALDTYVRVRADDVQFDLYGDGTLFVYRDDMALGADGHPHGACAVSLP